MRHAPPCGRALAQGLSLVELMVGMAMGLVIVAAALMALTHHMRESRSVIAEARLMQDLRTTADLMARDLRRAGHWGNAAHSVWQASNPDPQTNPHQTVSLPNPENPALPAHQITFSYSHTASETPAANAQAQFGYRLNNGAIDMQLGAGPWQSLTDSSSMRVTALHITPRTERISLATLCAATCSGLTCPEQQIRSLDLHITAQATADSRVSRSVQLSLRLRNDAITGACPT